MRKVKKKTSKTNGENIEKGYRKEGMDRERTSDRFKTAKFHTDDGIMGGLDKKNKCVYGCISCLVSGLVS